ncbi:MAG: hypothetical protein KC492_44510 [Myxococcales bacterium]|nr:hypothetical protein [Myxococcales bacterium]
MSAHTPGPWEAFESIEEQPWPCGAPQAVGTRAGKGARGTLVCDMRAAGPLDGPYSPNETWANARLIAAAPALYEALDDMLTISSGHPDGKPDHAWFDHCEEIRQRARAALAAAKGGREGGV